MGNKVSFQNSRFFKDLEHASINWGPYRPNYETPEILSYIRILEIREFGERAFSPYQHLLPYQSEPLFADGSKIILKNGVELKDLRDSCFLTSTVGVHKDTCTTQDLFQSNSQWSDIIVSLGPQLKNLAFGVKEHDGDFIGSAPVLYYLLGLLFSNQVHVLDVRGADGLVYESVLKFTNTTKLGSFRLAYIYDVFDDVLFPCTNEDGSYSIKIKVEDGMTLLGRVDPISGYSFEFTSKKGEDPAYRCLRPFISGLLAGSGINNLNPSKNNGVKFNRPGLLTRKNTRKFRPLFTLFHSFMDSNNIISPKKLLDILSIPEYRADLIANSPSELSYFHGRYKYLDGTEKKSPIKSKTSSFDLKLMIKNAVDPRPLGCIFDPYLGISKAIEKCLKNNQIATKTKMTQGVENYEKNQSNRRKA